MSKTAVIHNLPFMSSFSDFKPLHLFFSNLFSPPPLFFPFFNSLCSSLCFSLPPHPSLSRTTGACLLSSQCFYSLALAQGSIQSGPCIHFPSRIIHMLMWERAAFANPSWNDPDWASPAFWQLDMLLLWKQLKALQTNLLRFWNATYNTPHDTWRKLRWIAVSSHP